MMTGVSVAGLVGTHSKKLTSPSDYRQRILRSAWQIAYLMLYEGSFIVAKMEHRGYVVASTAITDRDPRA